MVVQMPEKLRKLNDKEIEDLLKMGLIRQAAVNGLVWVSTLTIGTSKREGCLGW